MNKKFWMCVVLLTASHAYGAQEPSAAPAAEQQAKAWLAAFNSGDKAALLEYLQKNRPADVGRIDGTLDFRARTGGFELVGGRKRRDALCGTSPGKG